MDTQRQLKDGEVIDALKNVIKAMEEVAKANSEVEKTQNEIMKNRIEAISIQETIIKGLKDELEEKKLELDNSADKIISLNSNRVHLTRELERLRTFEKEVKQQRDAEKFMNKYSPKHNFDWELEGCNFAIKVSCDAIKVDDPISKKEWVEAQNITIEGVSDDYSECPELKKAAQGHIDTLIEYGSIDD